LPFLRFTRDKRGHETTSLVHAFRGRQGRTRQKVLYWFRTPANVKVGRPALDEEAIRGIEERNPDVDFDWPKILEAKAPQAPPSEETRIRRPRRVKTERRGAAPQRPVPTRPPSSEPENSAPTPQAEQPAPPEPIDAGPEAEAIGPALPAAETVLGREQLVRVRAKYAELQARITERGGDAARVETLRAQAEPLNPDSWVTVDEARKAQGEFELKIRELRAALGLRRRRRSRRGGRRRHGGLPGAPAPTADSSSNQGGPEAEAGDENDGGEEGE
jgi:hypothetical protein